MVARKKTDDHGGVLIAAEAFYHAVHDYPGGVPAVAAACGWNAATLRNKLLPTVKTHKPTLDDVVAVLGLTKDPRLLTALLHPVGAVWHFDDAVAAAPGDIDVLGAGSSVIGKANGVLQELVTALEDGAVDPVEMSRIRQRVYETRQTLRVLLKTAEELAG